jgi:hypothetical protein
VQTKTREQTTWTLHGSSGELCADQLSARIDIARPHLGLHAISAFDSPTSTSILGVHRISDSVARSTADFAWPLPVAESYVRGNDLVGCYEPIADWPFSPQLYWQAGTLRKVQGVLASLSLLVSVQTHLLDTCPQIGVSSQVPAGETVVIAIGESGQHRVEPVTGQRELPSQNESLCIVRRPQSSPHSYIEIMEPSDFRVASLSSANDDCTVEWQLFADFLEKGVIRRARVHTAFVPRENDLELATVCCDAASHLELPLTT